MEAFTDHTVDADAAGFLEAFHPEAIKTACRWAAVLIAYVLYRFWNEGLPYSGTFRADGRVAIVTGASSGVGLQTARGLAARGARVYLACRSERGAQRAQAEIARCTGNTDVHYLHLDLERIESVREFVRQFRERETHLDVLVNNAAVLRAAAAKGAEQRTGDGLELHMSVNYYGAFMLSALLMDRLRAAKKRGIRRHPGRIVNVTSDGHGLVGGGLRRCEEETDDGNGYVRPFRRYLESKLAMVVFTKELARRMKEAGHVNCVTVNCVHPGWNISGLDRHLGVLSRCVTRALAWLFFKSSWSAAQTPLYAALDVNLQAVSGEYISNQWISRSAAIAENPELGKWLWQKSETVTGVRFDV